MIIKKNSNIENINYNIALSKNTHNVSSNNPISPIIQSEEITLSAKKKIIKPSDINADNIDDYIEQVVNHDKNTFQGKKYNLSNDKTERIKKAKQIAALCIAENGNDPKAIAATVSVLANNIDTSKNYNNPIDFLDDRNWYASDSLDCYNNPSNLKKLGRDKVTPESIAIVYDVLVNGNRTTKANEHDSFGDILKIEYNGEVYTYKHPEDIENKKLYVPGETIIYNRYGSKYLFTGFPANNKTCDPFGEKIENWEVNI